jgi:phosphopantetheinyl transferase
MRLAADVDESWLGILEAFECERAAGFRTADARRQFVAAHVLLRIVVGACMGVPAAQLRLHQVCPRCGGNHGKPSIVATCGIRPPSVSIAHTRGLVCVALAAASVGVDVEEISPGVVAEGLAEDVLTPNELRAYRDLPEASRPPAFFERWTEKEAWFKATGERDVFGDLDVPLAASSHRSFRFSPPPGYAGCVVAQAKQLFVHELRETHVTRLLDPSRCRPAAARRRSPG